MNTEEIKIKLATMRILLQAANRHTREGNTTEAAYCARSIQTLARELAENWEGEK